MVPAGWRVLVLGAVAMVAAGCRSVLGIEQTQIDPRTCTWLTQRVFFADKPVDDTTVTVGVITQARFDDLATELGVALDPNRGHGLAEVVDCEDEPAEFAAADFEPSGAGVTGFVVAGDRLVAGTDTGVQGALGALNLETPAELLVTAHPDEIDVPSSAGDIVTRAGELGRIVLVPNSEVTDVPSMSANEWECVGTIVAEPPTEPTITLTVDVQASGALVPNGVGVEGVRVAVCLDDAAACEPGAPVPDGQSAVTDGSGRAQLVVSTSDEGFDGHLVISGTVAGCGE